MRDKLISSILTYSLGLLLLVNVFYAVEYYTGNPKVSGWVENDYQEAIKQREVTILKRDNAIYKTVLKDLIKRVVHCESGGRHNQWGDLDYTYKSFGIAQFQERTFEYLKELAGMEYLEWRSEEDQITLLTWAIENGYGNYWTCYRNITKENNEYRRYFG